jgi:O-acetylserine/cysteine efflux transporter
MRRDISPGLASLLIQLQVFFTIGLSIWIFRERLSTLTVLATLLSATGLATVGLHLDASVTLKGVLLVVAAAFCWAGANVTVKKAAHETEKSMDMLAFIVWSSLFAVPPLLLLTLMLEGAGASWHAITHARLDAWAALVWQAVANTLFGYAAWNWLLARYAAAVVTPYALLVPVFGMGASALVVGEELPPWKLAAGAMVMAGIALLTLKPRQA